MKRVILIVVLAILLVAGCAETAKVQPAAWLLSGANVQSGDSENEIEDTLEYVGRVGVQVGQTEAGLASNWFKGNPRQEYGVYFIQFLAQDPNNLLSKTYIGAQATLDVKEEGGMYGFMAGTILNVGGVDLATEFRASTYTEALGDKMDSQDRYKVFVGPRFKF